LGYLKELMISKSLPYKNTIAISPKGGGKQL
jgi:hypothetical protein